MEWRFGFDISSIVIYWCFVITKYHKMQKAHMHVVANTCATGNVTGVASNFGSESGAVDGQQLTRMHSSSALGLEILYESCKQVYPLQPNPLQVTAFIKYWWVHKKLQISNPHLCLQQIVKYLQKFKWIMNSVYRLGGPDPLDYISMYDHPGIPELHIPPHWHYIRYSDIWLKFSSPIFTFVVLQFWPYRLAWWW